MALNAGAGYLREPKRGGEKKLPNSYEIKMCTPNTGQVHETSLEHIMSEAPPFPATGMGVRGMAHCTGCPSAAMQTSAKVRKR